jgi:large subunit ribosomal protein L30
MNEFISIKQTKSTIGIPKSQRLLLKSLGLRKINRKIYVKNNTIVKKLLFKVQHLVSIENKYIKNSS